MTSFVIPVQLTAIVTAGVLLSICLVSAVKGQTPDSCDCDRSLVELVDQLGKEGHSPFCEICKDDGYWKVEVNRDGVAYELTIHRKSAGARAESTLPTEFGTINKPTAGIAGPIG